MSDDPKHNHFKTRRRGAMAAIAFFVLIALYLTGFVVAPTVGPGLSPPVSNVLSVIYWPLIKADENNIETFKSIIQWLRHGPKPPPASGEKMTTPAAPRAAR